jgi:hypothetical protein
MPHIADSMDGIDTRFLDNELWQRLEQNVGHYSEHLEDHDFKKDKPTNPRDQLRSFVAKYLSDKLAKRLRISMTYLPWSKIKVEDIINWPPDVEFRTINKMNTNDVKKIYALAKEDQLDFSPRFISRLSSHGAHKEKALDIKPYITNYLQDKLAKKLNISSINVPWSQIKTGDIVNWPSDIELIPISQMSTKEVNRLYALAKEDKLDFSSEFLRIYSSNRAGSRNQFQSDITKYLAHKLARKLNVPSIKVPWSQIKSGDIINWPSDVEFMPLSHMKIKEVQRLYALAKADQLDFSPEFLRIYSSKRAGYMNSYQLEISKYLRDKLAKKLNISGIKVPWSRIKAGDIVNWPSDVKFIPIIQMSTKEVNSLYALVKEDKLDFSPKFISQFNNINRDGDKLRSDITKYLGAKLAKNLNVSSIRVPWSKIKADDIINWPSDMEFKPVYQINLHGIERLHLLAERDLLDFAPEFISQFKNINRYGDELRSDILKY